MSEMWKRWEGQVIDHKYQLRQFLGSTDHSAVFCAEFRDPDLRKAGVKFLAADLPHAEQVLADWKRAQQLSHPNLLPIYSVGRCRIQDMDLIYAATEYADENLSEILPQRALTASEAQEMLAVVADVLVYLHANKLTHGHIKPSNIFATGDQLKLSSDTIQPLTMAREMRRKRDVYDAPEIPASPFSPAADVWSLGVTLVEALTQQPAVLPFNESAEPVVAPSLRDQFREIAINSLRRDPASRWSSVDIAVKLNPEAADAVKAALAAAASTAAASSSAMNAAAASGVSTVAIAPPPPAPAANAAVASEALPSPPPPSPLSVPLSKEPAVPLSKLSPKPPASPRPPVPPPPITRPESKPSSRSAVVLPNYVVPLFAVVLIIAAIVALPKILHRQTQPSHIVSTQTQTPTAPTPASNSTSSPSSNVASVPKQTPTPAPPLASNSPSSANSLAPSTSAPPSTSSPSTLGSSPATSSAVLQNSAPVPTAAAKKASSSPDRGEVLDQVMPRPGSSALATIQGTVRVVVRLQVDPAGNVSQATLENSGSSKYFADKSVQAARGWVFLAPTGDGGHGEPSEWLIRFEFTSAGVNAYPKQVKP